MLSSVSSSDWGSGRGQRALRREDRRRLAGLRAVVAAGTRRRPRARRTSYWSCSTTSDSPSSAATARTSTPRSSTAWPPGACVCPTSTPLPCAHPPGPACSPDATTTAAGWAAWPTWRSGSPATGASRHGRTASSRRSCAPTGYATYAVGKWHLSPEDETNMAAPRGSTWPLGRGFDRWYGFHGGETHQFVPALFHDNHAVRPPRTVEEGYHLSADLADRAIEFVGDLRAVDAETPFFLYFCTGACHSPHQAPAGVDRALPGPLRPGLGRLARARPSPASSRSASCPGHRALPATRRGSRPGNLSTSTNGSWPSGSWSPSPPSSPTPTSRSAVCSPSSTTWAKPTTPSSWWSRTTGPAPRAASRARSTRGGSPTSTVPAWTRCTAASTRSAGRAATTTTRGAGPWPATRRSSVGSARSTKAASPTLASSGSRHAGRAAPAVRSGASSPTPSTSSPPCSSWPASTRPGRDRRDRPVAPRRHQLRLPARRRAAPTSPDAT